MESVILERSEDGTWLSVETAESEPTPPSAGEAVVRVTAAGVCGSDVGAYRGKSAYDFVETPRALGHEYVGVVEAVGDGETTFEAGDVVVERPLRTCGTCSHCRAGRTNVCENVRITGFHHEGAFAGRVTVPTAYLHRAPPDVPGVRAALTEPLAVTARAVLRVGDVTAGDAVLVEGPGPMGALSALVADAAGADVVVSGLTRDAPRLRRLADAGVETVSLDERALKSVAPSDGFDAVVDATGAPAGVESGVDVLRNAGRVVVVGIPSDDLSLPGPELVRSELSVRASYGATSADFERALRLLSESETGGRLDALVDTYAPREARRAFEDFAAAESIKPVFEFETDARE